jgi:hypothetical protein
MPTFFSTVEVESLEFHGKASSSKKQAEQDAAKIAYTALKECKFIHLIDFMHKNCFDAELRYKTISRHK